MALPKVCGIETEYGVISRGFDSSPIVASSVLVNAYAGAFKQSIQWDFGDETPDRDARGFSLEDAFPPEVETHMANSVLTNGARYYVDHAHPEVSTPECRTAMEVVLYDRAGEQIIRESMQRANALLPEHHEIITYKNNSDGKGNSYGCHENYLVSRELPFGQLATFITTHFITRQIYCGSGKVGSELFSERSDAVTYQISQRADFFEEEIGLETTIRRPIINTRDEPHCDPDKYRRLHVIVGDANMSEYATYLKVGTTAIVLAMIEDGAFPTHLIVDSPVNTIRTVSRDISLAAPIRLANGTLKTSLEIQFLILEAAEKYSAYDGLQSVCSSEFPHEGTEILRLWRETLNNLSNGGAGSFDTVDWLAKMSLINAYQDRNDLSPNDARLKALDLQYHDMRPGKNLSDRMNLRKLVAHSDAERARIDPPQSTRAYFRGECLKRWPEFVVSANWDCIIFDVGDGPLRRIPMMEPLKGTRALTESLFNSCATPLDLVLALGLENSDITTFKISDVF
jgi:Pup amidohydrolase